MNAQYSADLAQLLQRVGPGSVLCLGAPCPPVVQDYVAAAPGRRAEHRTQAAPELGRFDLILVQDLLEHMDKGAGEQLLARLRDLQGGHFLLNVAVGPHRGQATRWDDNELLALGLVRVGFYPEADGEHHLYRFDLDDYKIVPDWFNPRFWAHPERWDKEFW